MIARLAGLPQVWLVVFALAGLLLGRIAPWPAPLWLQQAAWLLAAAGFALMILAARTMSRARTTFMPGQVPARLVTWGVFARSRNPIYLGDLLVLAGFLLACDAATGLIFVPLFASFLTRRFIHEEESLARAAFGAEYESYAARVRRWI